MKSVGSDPDQDPQTLICEGRPTPDGFCGALRGTRGRRPHHPSHPGTEEGRGDQRKEEASNASNSDSNAIMPKQVTLMTVEIFWCHQGVIKRCRLAFLTNSALVYESKCRGDGKGCRVSANEYSCVCTSRDMEPR
jgi:hypothetical protein